MAASTSSLYWFYICHLREREVIFPIALGKKKKKKSRRRLDLIAYLYKWFSNCGPWTSTISIIWELVRNLILMPLSWPNESKTFVVGPSNLCLNKPSRWFWCMLKLDNHWSVSLVFTAVWNKRERIFAIEIVVILWSLTSTTGNLF